jgi:hypothetical protein
LTVAQQATKIRHAAFLEVQKESKEEANSMHKKSKNACFSRTAKNFCL